DVRRRVRASLGGVDGAGPLDRDLEGRADVTIEVVDGRVEDLLRHAEGGRPDAVEALGEVVERLCAPVTDLVTDRPHRRESGLDVVLGAWEERAQVPGAERPAAEIDRGEHGASLDSSPPCPDRRLTPRRGPGRRRDG